MTEILESSRYSGLEIAVIGMAGRFPGAKTVYEFWENLIQGKESIAFFSDRELMANHVEPELLKKTLYVKAKGVLEKDDYFDADLSEALKIINKIIDVKYYIKELQDSTNKLDKLINDKLD